MVRRGIIKIIYRENETDKNYNANGDSYDDKALESRGGGGSNGLQ